MQLNEMALRLTIKIKKENKPMNEKIANKILDLLDYYDYEIIAIYESSFRAIRKNEYILSELNIEVFASDYNIINENNIYERTSISTHVLKRYK